MHTLTHNLYRKVESVAVAYNPQLPRIATILVIVCTLSAFLYSVFLLEAVAQAASRTSAERQIEELGSQLSVLEGQYLQATQSLTPQRAKTMGFVAPSDVSTVIVNGKATSLTFVGR